MAKKGPQDLVDLFETSMRGDDEIPNSERAEFDEDTFAGERDVLVEGANFGNGQAIGDYIGGRVVKTLKPQKITLRKSASES